MMRLKTAFQDEVNCDFDRLLTGAADAFKTRFVKTVTEWLELWIVYSGEFIVADDNRKYDRAGFQPKGFPKGFDRRTCRAAEAFLTFWRKRDPRSGSDFGELGLGFANGEMAVERADLAKLKNSLRCFVEYYDPADASRLCHRLLSAARRHAGWARISICAAIRLVATL